MKYSDRWLNRMIRNGDLSYDAKKALVNAYLSADPVKASRQIASATSLSSNDVAILETEAEGCTSPGRHARPRAS